MCLAVLSFRQNKRYPLIALHNRDEYYSRGFDKARFQGPRDKTLAGVDQDSGGYWFALNKKGRFAIITNYRDFSLLGTKKESRGNLARLFLDGDESAISGFTEYLRQNGPWYNPFNLLYGDSRDVRYYSNVGPKEEAFKAGLYALSNAHLDTPWFKVERAKGLFRQLGFPIEQEASEVICDRYLPLLLDEKKAADDNLPQTGLSRDMEKKASSIFNKSEKHGTVVSTVFILRNDGQANFCEYRFHLGDKHFEKNSFGFFIG